MVANSSGGFGCGAHCKYVFREVEGGFLEPTRISLTGVGEQSSTSLTSWSSPCFWARALSSSTGSWWMVLACCYAVHAAADGAIGADSVSLLSSHAGMKNRPLVQILAHRDKRQLCFVGATKLADSRSQGDERGGVADLDARQEMQCLAWLGWDESQEAIELDSQPLGGRRRSNHEDDFDVYEKVD
eukprot:101624-Pleurochrysis_carterae.AAC.1